jgi:hypothetical protein
MIFFQAMHAVGWLVQAETWGDQCTAMAVVEKAKAKRILHRNYCSGLG